MTANSINTGTATAGLQPAADLSMNSGGSENGGADAIVRVLMQLVEMLQAMAEREGGALSTGATSTNDSEGSSLDALLSQLGGTIQNAAGGVGLGDRADGEGAANGGAAASAAKTKKGGGAEPKPASPPPAAPPPAAPPPAAPPPAAPPPAAPPPAAPPPAAPPPAAPPPAAPPPAAPPPAAPPPAMRPMVNATIVGENNIKEGGQGAYKVQLDAPVSEDTWFTIDVQDGTAQRNDNLADARRQDIIWGGYYDLNAGGRSIQRIDGRVPNGNDPSSGDRAAVGPNGDDSWDFTVTQNGAVQTGGQVQVLVRAGQTMSDTFNVEAHMEQVTVDANNGANNAAANEGAESFQIAITGSEAKGVAAPTEQVKINQGSQTVNITDMTQIRTLSPVTLDLDGSGAIETTGVSTARDRADGQIGQTVAFDMNADGVAEQIEWLSGGGDGLLVDNRDGQAATDMNGARLFGDQGGAYDNGYQKMAELDADGDGALSGAELEGLEVWVDDGDAKVEAGELKTLNEIGVSELSTGVTNVQNDRGETLMQSTATDDQGGSILTEDVWFAQK